MLTMIAVAAAMCRCLADGPDESVRVTYSTRAARAPIVLKELGAAAKVPLLTAPQMENEVLLINVRDTPLSEIMACVATVTSGEWKQEGASYRLAASARTRKQEEQNELARATASTLKILRSRVEVEEKGLAEQDKLIERAKLEVQTTKDLAAVSEAKSALSMIGMGRSADEDAVITSLLKVIDPSLLAQIGMGDRLVFSSDPTRFQRELGRSANDTVRSFIKKHNRRVLLSGMGTQFTDGAKEESPLSKAWSKSFERRNSKIGDVGKLLLIVTKGFDLDDPLEAELRIYDEKGAVAYAVASTLTNPTPPGEPPIGVKLTPIEYSADSEELIQSMRQTRSGGWGSGFRLSAGLKQRLFSPDRIDPLSFLQTDEVMAYAKSKGLGLVADIPDDWEVGEQDTRFLQSQSLEAIEQDIRMGDKLVVVPDATLMVLRPTLPAKSRAIRANRVAQATLLKAVEKNTVPSLDDFASYAMASPRPNVGSIDYCFLDFFVPGALVVGQMDWEMLRLYGFLTPESRARLAQGAKLGFASLSSDGRAALERIVYGNGVLLTIDDPTIQSDGVPASRFSFDGYKDGTDFREEPTEIAPNGLPPDGFLNLRSRREPFAYPIDFPREKMEVISTVLTPDVLALFKLTEESHNSNPNEVKVPSFVKFKIGETDVLDFSFHLASKVSSERTLFDRRLLKDAPTSAPDGLPTNFQNAVANSLAKLKKGLGSPGSGSANIHP